MEKTIIRAEERGHANHGWLDSYHTFSFAAYYNPKRIHFGALRVVNDDSVAPGMGFGRHPHENMEIISIPLEGDLEHEDSMGHQQAIRSGDVQVMSAGTGVYHSEYNKNKDKPVKFLQIWVIPDEKDVQPRYDQIKLDLEKANNKLYNIIAPKDEGAPLWIHQKAWFSLLNLKVGNTIPYALHKEKNGLFIFVLEGKVNIGDEELNRRDTIALTGAQSISMSALDTTELLLIEVPMISLR